MEKRFGVNIFGFVTGEFGLGEAVRLIAKAFQKAEIPISLINYDIQTNHRNNDKTFDNHTSEVIYPINLVLLGPSEGKKILLHYADQDTFKNKYNIFYLNWESEYISQEYIDNLSFYDEIWVPAQYCKDILEKYCNIPVKIVPYPMEIVLKDEKDEIAKQFYDSKSFNFLFIFDYNSTIERKNPLNLIEAFGKAFGKADETVQLIIKTSKSDKFQYEKNLLLQKAKGFKNIKIVEEIYDKQTLHRIIKNCDAYISLHRSEGFGLTMAETMFFGKPVIATNYSGNLQFMNEDNSFLVDFKKSKIESNNINYDKNTLWSEPNVNHAAELLKIVRENSAMVQEKAALGKQTIVNELSSKKIGDQVRSLVERISKNYNLNSLQNTLIDLMIENEDMKFDLYIIRKSKLMMTIFNVKMYFRNRKNKRK